MNLSDIREVELNSTLKSWYFKVDRSFNLKLDNVVVI